MISFEESGCKTVLEYWELTSEDRPPFVSRPRYYKDGDFVTYFINDERCTGGQLNSNVTIYKNYIGELIGVQIWGVKKIAGDFAVPIKLKTILNLLNLDSFNHERLVELVGDNEVVV